jgi:hypothetical protein
MPKGQGFPLSKGFNKGLWDKWDKLSPEQREKYEVYYEDKDNARVNKEIEKER